MGSSHAANPGGDVAEDETTITIGDPLATGRVQEEANSVEHALTYEQKPLLSVLHACPGHSSTAFQHDIGVRATSFGDLVTADHAYSHRKALEGFEGSRTHHL